jgi:DNA-binding CsgD family transcriptional regulator
MKSKILNFIEFSISENGMDILCRKEGKYSILSESDTDLIDQMYCRIREDYTEAFDALMKIYQGAWQFKWLCVRRFIKCNFARQDEIDDIQSDGRFVLEFVSCPLRGECQYDHIICCPKFNTNLTTREIEIIKLIVAGLEDEEIANKLFISYHTVCNHRRHVHSKLGTSSKAEIVDWAYRNKIVNN